MDIISRDKKYKITMPDELYRGKVSKDQTVEVHIYPIEEKGATIYNLAYAIQDCFTAYKPDYSYWAPMIYVYVHVKEKIYRFNMDWHMQITDYISAVAKQFEL